MVCGSPIMSGIIATGGTAAQDTPGRRFEVLILLPRNALDARGTTAGRWIIMGTEQPYSFYLQGDDLLDRVILSGPILFENDEHVRAVVCFYVIRREQGHFEIVCVRKTWKLGKVIGHSVQVRKDIPAASIEGDIKEVFTKFTEGIREETGYEMVWSALNLDHITDRHAQMAEIKRWGGIRAFRCCAERDEEK